MALNFFFTIFAFIQYFQILNDSLVTNIPCETNLTFKKFFIQFN